MAIRKFFSIAYRNLIRNGRRTTLTALAVALGLVVVMAMSGLIEGMVTTMLADNIRLSSGHMQIRRASYEADKTSLLARDLLRDGDAFVTQLESRPEVESATPVLWLGGLLSTSQESVGLQIIGIDTDSPFHAPIREGVVAGEYLQNDDRRAVLISQMLADQMDIVVGQRVSIATASTDGGGQEGVFTVVGLIDTGFPSVDHHRMIMPLEQAQTFSGVGDRFSSLIIMLKDGDSADRFAQQLADPALQIVTWDELNSLILESVENGLVVYNVLYAIVFLAVGILIANTLLMSVFSRAQEIGILGSLGMNRLQIMLLFLSESLLLAIFGTMMGIVLGLGAVAYMTYVGISFPAETATLVDGFAIGTVIYGGFAFWQFAFQALMLLIIVSIVSLYPAWFAAKMEPVDALRAL